MCPSAWQIASTNGDRYDAVRRMLAVTLTARGPSTGVFLAAVIVAIASSCSALAPIEVCHRGPGSERQVNHRTDGDQRIENTRSLVALPSGGALITFTSLTSSDASEIRGALLSEDGVTLRTCGSDGETTWIPYANPGPSRQLHNRPTLGRPLANGVYGLLAYEGTVDGSEEQQVFVQALDTSGCPDGAPTQISAEPAGATVSWLQVAATAPREFMVIWAVAPTVPSAPNPVLAIRARAVKISTSLPIEYLPTIASSDGDTVDLVTNVFYEVVAAAERGDGGVLLAWSESAIDVRRIHLTSYDEVLRVNGDVIVSSATYGAVLDQPGIDVASDGTQALVTWVERDEAGVPRVFGRFFTPKDLLALRAPQAPTGDKFPLDASTASANQGYPSLATAPGGGMVALWNEAGDPTRHDTSGASVRAVLVGRSGELQFSDQACGNTDFQVNVGTNDNQLRPNGLMVGEGTLLAGWSDYGQNGGDRFADNSGAGVRLVVLPSNRLRPTK